MLPNELDMNLIIRERVKFPRSLRPLPFLYVPPEARAGAFGRTQRDGGHAACAEEILKCVPGRRSPHARAKRLAPARSAPSAPASLRCAAGTRPRALYLRAGPRRAWSSQELENRRREEPPRAVPENRRTGGMRNLRAPGRKHENRRRKGLP